MCVQLRWTRWSSFLLLLPWPKASRSPSARSPRRLTPAALQPQLRKRIRSNLKQQKWWSRSHRPRTLRLRQLDLHFLATRGNESTILIYLKPSIAPITGFLKSPIWWIQFHTRPPEHRHRIFSTLIEQLVPPPTNG